jgi:flagellar FliL protein
MAAIRPSRPAAKKQAPQQPAAPAEPPPPPPAAGKQRSMTMPAILIAVALLGAAFMLKGGGGGGGSTTNAETTATTEAPHAGPVVALDAITLNLAGGDIVKVGIALQLEEGSLGAEEAGEDKVAWGARALDEAITVLGAYTREELTRPGGLADAKDKLSKRVALAYHDEVIAVYFTQFVIA